MCGSKAQLSLRAFVLAHVPRDAADQGGAPPTIRDLVRRQHLSDRDLALRGVEQGQLALPTADLEATGYRFVAHPAVGRRREDVLEAQPCECVRPDTEQHAPLGVQVE